MDIILHSCDSYFFTPYIYPESWSVDSASRQLISLTIIVCLSGYLLYFIAAGLSFFFVFDRSLMKHPLFIKNQVSREIWLACTSLPFMGFLSSLCFFIEIRGYSKLYDYIDESKYGWLSIPFTTITFILYTDCLIYWIHRSLHSPWAYKRFHKPHHLWKVPTPFASHAFHPLDGFLQGLPYHLYVFMFPMHKYLFLVMFTFVNFWTVSIHDGNFKVPYFLKPVVNGAAHHADHHLLYNYNYGQFFTLWDRIGGSFREIRQ